MSTPKPAPIPGIYMRVKDPKKIKKLMAIDDVSTRQLAIICGYRTHAYISAILNGKIKTIAPDRAARIARHFDVKVDDLFEPRLSTDTSDTAKTDEAA